MIFVGVVLLSCYGCSEAADKSKRIFGRLEQVRLEHYDTVLKAKLDTGARTSSLNAINIRSFEKSGKPWIAFDVPVPGSERLLHFDKILLQIAKIKNRKGELAASGNTPYSQRPVVRMRVCLGNRMRKIKVNLVDRRHFLYPMLIGASAIRFFSGMVDPSRVYTREPTCTATRSNPDSAD